MIEWSSESISKSAGIAGGIAISAIISREERGKTSHKVMN
jgi:hypothetical protein